MTEERLKEVLEKHAEWLRTRFYDDVKGERANLQGANLQGANLWYADLRYANLRGANLQDANLRDADLRDADLRDADLRDADLRDANLRDADLRDADLRDADLRDVIGIPLACPEKGEFIGFKKAYHESGGVVVELSIPADSKRSSATGRKCRCDKAKVIDITSLDGNTHYKSAISFHESDFIYVVGKTVTVENFEDDRWNECAPGIHFFITRQEAVEY